MKGRIYTEEKCSVCGSKLIEDRNIWSVCCPDHPEQKAKTLVVWFGRKVKKRFSDDKNPDLAYRKAYRWLESLRERVDDGVFDQREFQIGNPLGFSNLVKKYLEVKELEQERGLLAKGTLGHIRHDLNLAAECFGNRVVKEIMHDDLQLFLLKQEGRSSKTISNIAGNLHAFWMWLRKTKRLKADDVPEFPEIEFELGWRNTIDKHIQNLVLEEIREATKKSPRLYLAFQWLCTYTSIRPDELRGVLESDINLETGFVTIRHHKTNKKTKSPKLVPLLDEDIEFIKTLPRGMPHLPFFRHDASIKGMPPNTPFGNRILRKVWNRACKKLEIGGVDLYGGCRHSTQQFYRQFMSTEDCQRLSQHTTSKAGARYLKIQRQELIGGYSLARGGIPEGAGIRPVYGRSNVTDLKTPK